MAKNSFKPQGHYDIEIMNDDEKIGELRIKPNNILWAPKGSHKWLGVTLDDFKEWIEKNGKEQKK